MALDSLKFQHAALAKSMASFSHVDSAPPSGNGSIITSRVEEEADADIFESPVPSPNLVKSSRTSTMTTGSDRTWYDAPDLEDGPQEFLLDSSVPDEHIPDSRLLQLESVIDQDSVDTDCEDDAPRSPANETTSARRTQLPALPPADEGSLFAVLKKNIGKVCHNPRCLYIMSHVTRSRISRVLSSQLHSMNH